MSLVRIVDPEVEPVSVDELLDHIRVTSDREQILVRGFIASAREWAEQYTGRAFLWQRWRQSYDVRFPAVIRLMRSPLIVSSGSPASPVVSYYDAAGALIGYTTFWADADADPPVLRPAYDTVWPQARTYLGTAVTVTYDAGYGTLPEQVPEPIRLAIKMQAAYYFVQREAVTDQSLEEAPMAVKALLSPYRSRWLFAA